VQADPKTYAKYAAAPQTADALAKLQRFHALVKANGGKRQQHFITPLRMLA
jgi:hypothetical protein